VQLSSVGHSTLIAAFEPNTTVVLSCPVAKPLPVRLTLVPPATVPLWGLALVTVGGPYRKRARDEGSLVPSALVTLTRASPLLAGGETALTSVAESTWTS